MTNSQGDIQRCVFYDQSVVSSNSSSRHAPVIAPDCTTAVFIVRERKQTWEEQRSNNRDLNRSEEADMSRFMASKSQVGEVFCLYESYSHMHFLNKYIEGSVLSNEI